MKYLFVVAHADDEVLGGGAMIYDKTRKGSVVDVCILSKDDFTRSDEQGAVLLENMRESHRILGVRKTFVGDFPDTKFNVVPMVEMVRFIEKVIEDSCPDVVITHSPSDLNPDHVVCSHACQQASRISQRLIEDTQNIKALYFMEVQSATDWHSNTSIAPFRPDTFVSVSTEAIKNKIMVLGLYKNVIRPYPHPRSEASIKALATIRGTQSGFGSAEAFETAWRFTECL